MKFDPHHLGPWIALAAAIAMAGWAIYHAIF